MIVRLFFAITFVMLMALGYGCSSTDEYGVSVDQSQPPRLVGSR